jgi:hypothetical protein
VTPLASEAFGLNDGKAADAFSSRGLGNIARFEGFDDGV